MSDTPPSPQPPLALIAEATKRAGVIWIAIQGQDRPRPAWHIWRAGPLSPGAAYVVTGPGEQPLPGLAGSGRVTVIVPRGAGGGPVSWTAVVSRVEPGSGEWDEVIGPLVAGRLNAVLAEGETSPARRWARSGAVFRLAPLADDPAVRNSRTVLSAALPAVHPSVCGHGTPLAGIADRCGYGQRLPFLLISPYAKTHYVSGTTADQTSLLAFIEDNWLGGQRTGGGSFDALAGPLDNMFSFGHPHFAPYLLDPATGEPVQ